MKTFEENLFNFLCSGSRALFTHLSGFCVTSCSRMKRTPLDTKETIVSFPLYPKIIKKLLNPKLEVSVVRLHKMHIHVQLAENWLNNKV